MKVSFISDLHVDSSPVCFTVLKHLKERLCSLRPDVFIIAGDVSANEQLIAQTLNYFSELSCCKIMVAGNHDIWVASPSKGQKGISSGEKYHEILPRVCEQAGFVYLGLEPFFLDGIGFAGTIGWYDYTLRNKRYDSVFSMDAYRSKQYREKFTWNDLHYVHWMDNTADRRKCDAEVAREMESSLKCQLQSLSNRGVSKVVVVTHHVPFRQMIFYPHCLPFDFFSAFMGSEGLGETILSESAVTHLICGHSHIKSSVKVGPVQAMKSPLGYPREWRTKDLRTLAEEKLGVFEV
jgi:Icc-related predicted phosphoesterase